MTRFNPIFRHLVMFLKLPKIDLKTRDAKVVFGSRKPPEFSFQSRLREFFKGLRLFLHSSSKPKEDGFHRLSFFKQISLMLRTSNPKPNVADRTMARRALLEALRAPPRVDIKNQFKKQWLALRILFRSRTITVPDDVSRFSILLPALWEDTIRFRRSAYAFSKNIAVPLRTHWKIITVAILLVPVLLELLLQSASMLSWGILELRQKTYPHTEKVILCIGDSYTSGQFTAYALPPYTQPLEDLMRNQGFSGWKIVNHSAPHLDSSEALQSLRLLLKKERPAIVYIMIGINDFLEKPEVPDEPAWVDELQPERTLRTGMFFKMWLNHGFSGGLFEAVATPPFFVEIEDKSTPKERDISVSESELQKLLLFSQSQLPPAHQQMPVENLPQDEQSFSSFAEVDLPAWAILRKGALDVAESQFREATRSNPLDPLPHSGLAETYYRLGLHMRARKELAWLQSHYQRNPNPVGAAALMYALPFVSSISETSKAAVEILERYPHNPWFWITLARCGMLSGHYNFAGQAIERALMLVPQTKVEQKSKFLRVRADITVKKEPQKALLSLMEAFLLDHDEQMFIDSLRNSGASYLKVDVKKTIAGISCPEPEKERLMSLYREAVDESLIGVLSTIERNFERMAMLCHDYSAQPVFLTYPVAQAHIARISRKVAEQTGSRWLNLEAQFEVLVKNDAERRIIQNGRYTSLAFRQIAELVGSDLRIHAMK